MNKSKKLKTRIFLFVDEATGEIWTYVYEGESEPIVIEAIPKPDKMFESDDDEITH